MIGTKTLAAALILWLSMSLASAQFSPAFQSPGAGEQFRLGVQAYHRGRYSEAILLFERSMAYEPRQALVSYWLGRAYEKSGLDATALRAWLPLSQDPAAPPLIKSKVEALRASRSTSFAADENGSYVEAARYSGILGKTTYFLRPSSILPRRDGSVLVVAQGSNELLRIDPNGVIKERDRGGLKGYDRPFGIASLPDGTLFMTEFNGDRIARLNKAPLLTFGQKGRGPGQLLGPQYAICDEEGYLYVVDYGNARVVKFDSEGTFVLSFGLGIDTFPGFVNPAGLAEKNGILYVADSYRKAIYQFDLSGNFLGSMAEGQLHFPEGIAFWKNGNSLLIADTDRIVSLDLESERVAVLYESPDPRARFVGAAADYNGNLLACDFDGSAILVLTEAPRIAAGYDIEIERVHSEAFPSVALEISVKDRFGNPVVGLAPDNFRLSERIVGVTRKDERGTVVEKTTESLNPIPAFDLVGTPSAVSPARVCFLLDRSSGMAPFRAETRDALASLFGLLTADGASSFSVVAAGALPSVMVAAGGGLVEITRAGLGNPESGRGRFDQGLRLAVSGFLPSSPRDIVIYIGTGAVDEKSFGSTTLSELTSYLRNNDIHLFAVVVGEGSPDPSIRYLVDASGGAIYGASRARGLADLAAQVRQVPSGRYSITYKSAADPRFGESYLSVAIEAYLYKKSGRDELGYFAPLR